MQVITKEQFEEYFKMWDDGSGAPNDVFLTIDDDGLWVAADNRDGYFFVEEFKTLNAALVWCEGEMNGMTAKETVRNNNKFMANWSLNDL